MIEVKFEEYDLDENMVRTLKGVNLENFELMSIIFQKENQKIIIRIKPKPMTEAEVVEGLKEMGVWEN